MNMNVNHIYICSLESIVVLQCQSILLVKVEYDSILWQQAEQFKSDALVEPWKALETVGLSDDVPDTWLLLGRAEHQSVPDDCVGECQEHCDTLGHHTAADHTRSH